MEFTVNKGILCSIMKESDNELIDFLNQVIDEEIEKEAPDCDLIDECINAIDELEADNGVAFIRLILTERQLIHYCKRHTRDNKLLKSAIAAGLVLMLGSATVLNASPAVAENVKALLEVITSTLIDITSDADAQLENVSSIYASLPEKSDLTINDIDDIDISQLEVTAVLDDGEEVAVDISDCTVQTEIRQTTSGEFAIVSISYGDCACSIAFEIKR